MGSATTAKAGPAAITAAWPNTQALKPIWSSVAPALPPRFALSSFDWALAMLRASRNTSVIEA